MGRPVKKPLHRGRRVARALEPPKTPPPPVFVPVEVLLNLIASHERERAEWRVERAELITRIQAWDPFPEKREDPPAAHPNSQPDEVMEEPPEEEGYTREELAKLGLMENSGGGFVHGVTGVLYERVSDFTAYQAWLGERGLPLNTKPSDVDQNLLVGGS